MFDNLLVSSPNNGGLFLLHESNIYKLDNFNTTGLSLKGRRVLRGIQPSVLQLYDTNSIEITNNIVPFDDIHDVYLDDEFVYLVGTSGNEIIKLNNSGEELQRWVFAGEKDAFHINCLSKWNGRIVFSAFGEFAEHRGYKGKTEKSGFVQDLYTEQRLITGLSQPHSLVPVGQNLFLANSEYKELSEYDPSGELVRTLILDGYTRGICVVNNIIYVGLSCSRNIEHQGVDTATVVALDRDSWRELGRIQLPATEVYAMQGIANHDDVIHLLANITSNSSFKLASSIAKHDGQIASLNQAIDERDEQIACLNQTIAERNEQIASLNQAVAERNEQIASLDQAVAERDGQIANITQAVAERDAKIYALYTSHSWRLTRPLRFLARLIRKPEDTMHLKNIANVLCQARIVADYVIRGDFDSLVKRIRLRKRVIVTHKQHAAIADILTSSAIPHDQTCWGIMATQHTLFIAHLIADHLREHGWKVEIMTEAPADFHHNWYVIICPQMFAKIPPGEKRIAFQMEQSVSSRWFNDDYFEILNNSLAVLEYALVNLDFMASKGVAYPHVYYLPVGASTNYGDPICFSERTCDILFYGDSKSSMRRREMLDALGQHFNVRVVNEVFSRDMLEVIKQARLVINLHYYEDALLEMPRIQECLSLGVPVVSESAQDQDNYPELIGAVRFFEQGSIPAMLNAVKAALEDPVSTERIAESVALSAQRFAFMFDRFLVAMGFLPASHVRHMSLPLPNSADRIAISLPETIGRRRIFETERPDGCVVFDGIRRRPGWVGCGLSYVALAQHAMKQGRSRINVMEDDVLLPPDFEVKMAVVHEFLDARPGKWDVFAGVIASLHPDAKILSVEVFKDITFVTINKMTSMVFNIYGEKALRLLASWDLENLDAESNTIDRFLESQADLRVVVTLPFFVGHREEVHSTLWGFQNIQYNDMIANSEQSLKSMVNDIAQ